MVFKSKGFGVGFEDPSCERGVNRGWGLGCELKEVCAISCFLTEKALTSMPLGGPVKLCAWMATSLGPNTVIVWMRSFCFFRGRLRESIWHGLVLHIQCYAARQLRALHTKRLREARYPQLKPQAPSCSLLVAAASALAARVAVVVLWLYLSLEL